ncbi:hypothetical protein HA050_14585 [Iodobacter sp. HSC-16F04]|uniref:Uncharacterized protein n=1 Tax=Iodobacter violaceini TaxID=3044271 RepID=A0ABX0KRR2_9NEIS|nr:hypothetical protein [Iodobacter violacea]NHQ87340.1 hypothetical protein [Iodobacter violacea]
MAVEYQADECLSLAEDGGIAGGASVVNVFFVQPGKRAVASAKRIYRPD